MAFDLLVVGSGPAGLSACLFGERNGLNTALFESGNLGGELVNRHAIDDYPGLSNDTSGPELREQLMERVTERDPEIFLEEVTGISDTSPIAVRTRENEYTTNALVLATGTRPAPLGAPGEQRYEGRGVFYCALCDAPLYADKTVAIAGDGEWVTSDAIFIAQYAETVVVIGRDASRDEHTNDGSGEPENIQFKPRWEVQELLGDETLQQVEIVDHQRDMTLKKDIDGLYVQNGRVPNTEFLEGTVRLNSEGEVEVDHRGTTSIDGVFATGDVRSGSPGRVISAIGDGITVAQSAYAHVKRGGLSESR